MNRRSVALAINNNNNNNNKIDSEIVCPQIDGKLVVAGQDKYMNNTSYLIK